MESHPKLEVELAEANKQLEENERIEKQRIAHYRHLTPNDLDFLKVRLENKKCGLLLGPNFYRDSDGNNILESFNAKTSVENIKFDEYENLFFQTLDRKILGKRILYSSITKFADSIEIPYTHELITQIDKFSLIINFSFDNILKKAFEKNGQTFFYDFSRSRNSPKIPDSKEMPILYNLFGDKSSGNSMIFMESDLNDFFIDFFSEKILTSTLEEIIVETDVWLLLGFDFRLWYLKPLLSYIFGIRNSRNWGILESQESIKFVFGEPNGLHHEAEMSYKRLFNIEFINMKPKGILEKLRDYKNIQ